MALTSDERKRRGRERYKYKLSKMSEEQLTIRRKVNSERKRNSRLRTRLRDKLLAENVFSEELFEKTLKSETEKKMIQSGENYEYVPVKVRFHAWKGIFSKKRSSIDGDNGSGDFGSNKPSVPLTIEDRAALDLLYPRSENCVCPCSCIMHCTCFDNIPVSPDSVIDDKELQEVAEIVLDDAMFDAAGGEVESRRADHLHAAHVTTTPVNDVHGEPGCSAWNGNVSWKDDEIIGDVCILPEGVDVDDYDCFPSTDDNDYSDNASIFSDVSSEREDGHENDLNLSNPMLSQDLDFSITENRDVADKSARTLISGEQTKSNSFAVPSVPTKKETADIYSSEDDLPLSIIAKNLNITRKVLIQDDSTVNDTKMASIDWCSLDLYLTDLDLNNSFDDRFMVESIRILTAENFREARQKFHKLGGAGHLRKEMIILRKTCDAIKACIAKETHAKKINGSRKRKSTKNLDIFSYDGISSAGENAAVKKKCQNTTNKFSDANEYDNMKNLQNILKESELGNFPTEMKNKNMISGEKYSYELNNNRTIDDSSVINSLENDNIIISQDNIIISGDILPTSDINSRSKDIKQKSKEIFEDSESKFDKHISNTVTYKCMSESVLNEDVTNPQPDSQRKITLRDDIVGVCVKELLTSIIGDMVINSKQDPMIKNVANIPINENRELGKEDNKCDLSDQHQSTGSNISDGKFGSTYGRNNIENETDKTKINNQICYPGNDLENHPIMTTIDKIIVKDESEKEDAIKENQPKMSEDANKNTMSKDLEIVKEIESLKLNELCDKSSAGVEKSNSNIIKVMGTIKVYSEEVNFTDEIIATPIVCKTIEQVSQQNLFWSTSNQE